MFGSLVHQDLTHTTYSRLLFAPDPVATAIKEMIEFDKDWPVGAINIPTIQVNKTNDITLGFIK